jgi:hypothetical protein
MASLSVRPSLERVADPVRQRIAPADHRDREDGAWATGANVVIWIRSSRP